MKLLKITSALFLSLFWFGNAHADYCNWYSQIVTICQNQNYGWGWENNLSCIGAATCSNQTGNGGIIEEPEQDLSEVYELIEQQQQSIAQLEAQISNLVQQNSEMAEQIETLQENVIPGLDNFISVANDQYGRPAVFFDEVNVYIRNGNPEDGRTDGNGLGNLILGYNLELPDNAVRFPSGEPLGPHCSGGYMLEGASTGRVELPTQESCEANGHVWADDHKTGSHSIVMGQGLSYTGSYNFISGFDNAALDGSSFVMGSGNLGAFEATVSGADNRAFTTGGIFGGDSNTMVGNTSLIMGGSGNFADGGRSMILGGNLNRALDGTIIGGASNEANAPGAMLISTGGSNISLGGNQSTIIGGNFISVDSPDVVIVDGEQIGE